MELENRQITLYTVGVSHKKAEASIRGKYTLSKDHQINLLKEAKETDYKGLFVLSTCNRTEITGYAEHSDQLVQLLCKYSKGNVEEFSRISNIYEGNQVIDHLFRVASGLESQILGDYEIVSQLKEAFKLAKEIQVVNAPLERLLNLVLQASKRVKNATHLSSGTTSVSYAAVQYMVEKIPNFNSKNILVFGLGKIGKNTCKNLTKYTDNRSVCLINRTHEKAISFVQKHPSIRNSNFKNLAQEIANSDVIVVSTGSDKPTVTKKDIPKNKKILILDLSVPQNVDQSISELEHVSLVDVDELSKIPLETLAIRKKEVSKAEEIIEVHKAEFNTWLKNRKLVPAINTLKESLEAIQKDEIDFHRRKIKDFDESQARILTNRFIQKITTQFVKHLKEEDTSVNDSIQVMAKVFGKL